MIRLHFLIGFCLILLTGCSQIDSILNKVPFLKDQSETEQVEEKKQTNTKETQDKMNENKQPSQQNELTLDALFFNQIEQVDGKNVILNPLNIMALVNKQFSLPDGYIPNDLIRPNVTFSFGNQDIEKSYLRKDAAVALEKMFQDAKKNGIELQAVSGYRSYDRQVVLFDAEVNRVGIEKAVQVVAVPGFSEHQTGLAMDISSHSANLNLLESFAATNEGKWLAENAHRFGFILRYPKGKETITGYQYEPWHFRYVGEKAAKIIFEKKLSLEEYFNVVEKI